MDHRHLNYEVPELAGKIPTCENIALVIWKLAGAEDHDGKAGSRAAVRVGRFVRGCTADGARVVKVSLTRRYRFAASHRLHTRER